MAEIGGITPINSGWQIKPSSDQKGNKKDSEEKEKPQKKPAESSKDNKPHIDDYA